ncbi:Hsp70 family protein [Mycobacterium hubeiense]|uniref:Hsp70 family protein n=1 Tax=Mycobacterium hubeiense TaxID=1867256 RepID=UPI000C7F3C75|nr:Hsp70 family protein [Mycobacterium sp. QGD 101]
MSDSLGLSIGATNLAAAREGHPAVIRASTLTLFSHRPPEVGLCGGDSGILLTGFVDRVGDPVPLVASDRSTHRAERLVAVALDAMTYLAGGPASTAATTYPAHWRPQMVGALRSALAHKQLVSDAVAGLTALQADPGLPSNGVVALCDFGGTGTSITLADAAAGFTPVGETVRYAEFSGDQIDQAILTHVMSGIADASDTDPSGTAMVGSLARLRAECRLAKERLSSQTATPLAADVSGFRSDIRLTRGDLENLMRGPLLGLVEVLRETLQRNGVRPVAVATMGGGAAIPLVTELLSEHLRVPVVTTPAPEFTAARGAAVVAARGQIEETATAFAPAVGSPETALAWSEEPVTDADITEPYVDDYAEPTTDARPDVVFAHEEAVEEESAPSRRPLVLFSLAALAALLAAGALIYTWRTPETATTPVETSAPLAPPPAVAPPPAPAPAPPAYTPPPRQRVVTQAPAPRQRPAAPKPAPAPAPPASPPPAAPPPPPPVQQPPPAPPPVIPTTEIPIIPGLPPVTVPVIPGLQPQQPAQEEQPQQEQQPQQQQQPQEIPQQEVGP